jgi:hypothetical protein
MAVPRIVGLVQRLQMAQHEAAVEDLLEATPPLLRVTFRPRRGPFIHGPPPPFATLEIGLQEGGKEELVTARWWIVPTVEPTAELSVPPSRAGGAWLDQVFVEFVEQVLERVR